MLAAYRPITVREHPDIGDRLRLFRNGLESAVKSELDRLEIKLDRTQDLRRLVKMYGTAKPNAGSYCGATQDTVLTSRFYGGDRVPDERLREHLLAFDEPVLTRGLESRLDNMIGTASLAVEKALPAWFADLLAQDAQLHDLWVGIGKPASADRSRSGFDYSVMRRLLRLGRTDIGDLATILALRPNGAAREKGEPYIRRTLSNLLRRERIGNPSPD